ncbi:ComEC/Rec2 family competence protein [Aliivibrio sifiae]|uniref:MBL fold hydrolase n=1 Tax=Aliivibrio sifiae TaxID=566293 RepID=A0A2S7XHE1_9GAMM|nr:MBL fold metallo-hydrolase [Aliivibrio sifiae]PQJ93125.1 hypothetical protein BTO23_03250 [Aliivibrio sifiae]GLR75961.1 MBL fold hydrolase [Aliivibrio sifiae]
MLYIDILDAGHGDCLLVSCGDLKILIDSGPQKFVIRNRVANKLKELLNGSSVDVAFVTHNDDDHIGGYKEFIKKGIIINCFVFNSLELLGKVISVKTKKISFKQDINLKKNLDDEGIKVITLTKEDKHLHIGNVKITPLTPSIDTLSLLDNKFNKDKIKKISALKNSEDSLSECFNIINLKCDKFKKDLSITNKSSISFIIEYENTKALFLGDSHEKDIVDSLLDINENDRVFNVVKLSHHGSKKNTSLKLLKIIGITDYIICADKSKNNHPNNITLARILKFNNNPTIHMSSNDVRVRELFEQCHDLNFKVNVTYSDNGVNTVFYE